MSYRRQLYVHQHKESVGRSACGVHLELLLWLVGLVGECGCVCNPVLCALVAVNKGNDNLAGTLVVGQIDRRGMGLPSCIRIPHARAHRLWTIQTPSRCGPEGPPTNPTRTRRSALGVGWLDASSNTRATHCPCASSPETGRRCARKDTTTTTTQPATRRGPR